MKWDELLDVAKLGDTIRVKLLVPLRGGEHFTEGTFGGFKSGILGGGWNRKQTKFDSSKIHFTKKPKICVVYNICEFGKKPYMDWVDVDNCEFEIL